MAIPGAVATPELQALALALEKALSEVASKYRSCLSSCRFPVAYAEVINRISS